MRALLVGSLLVLGCTSRVTRIEGPPAPPPAAGELRGVEVFAAIDDPKARSRALFVEASRVLLHARCLNCHPAGDSPLQGMGHRLHDPPVARGEKDDGVPGLRCTGCHQNSNLDHARVPGAPGWHLAPKTMAWQGRSPAAICAQLKDPTRNGEKSLAQIVDHVRTDALVAWGWAPGHGREPAPGTQAQAGALFAAWVDTGAECPLEEASR